MRFVDGGRDELQARFGPGCRTSNTTLYRAVLNRRDDTDTAVADEEYFTKRVAAALN